MQTLDPNDNSYRNTYEGVVEDINDPLKMGRVRVRVFFVHVEDKKQLPTEKLPWSMVGLPTTSASVSGIGQTHGLLQGSLVAGYYRDPYSKQDFFVTHSIPTFPTQRPDASKGFNDPLGVYPSIINEPDVNLLAREKYPFNKVTQSESGHIIEIDDTPNDERININHRTGNGFGVNKDGDVLIKSNSLIVSCKNGETHKVEGDIVLNASGYILLNGANIYLNPSFGVSRSEFNEIDNFFKKNILKVASAEAIYEENPDYNVSPEQRDVANEGTVCYLGEEENPYTYAKEQLGLDWDERRTGPRNENIGLLWEELGYDSNSYDDSVSWCAVFVSAVLKRCKLKYLKTAYSRAYADFGTEIKSTYTPTILVNNIPQKIELTEEELRIKHIISKLNNAQAGDILVFDRGDGLGHVGFYTGQFTNEEVFVCLGGNQGSTLKESFFNVNSTVMKLTDIRRAGTCKTREIFSTNNVPVDCMLPTKINDFDTFQIFVRNLYFEARSEPDEGIVAVAHVVLNRAKDTVFYPNVNDPGSVIRENRAFSWYDRGQPTRNQIPKDEASWIKCCNIAKKVLSGEIPDNTNGALFYYSVASNITDESFLSRATIYKSRARFVKQIARHRFFKIV